MKRILLSLILPGFLLLLNACSEERVPNTYQVPEKTEDGWEVASMDEAGLDSELLEEYFEGYLYSMDPSGSNGMKAQVPMAILPTM